jgi:hypothetical protein
VVVERSGRPLSLVRGNSVALGRTAPYPSEGNSAIFLEEDIMNSNHDTEASF